ncbi:MAG: response regulator transcription factor [Chloroflexi bacterium]|nr:response regulator transcription factor [Chloroflexota bacterium]
MTQTRPIRVAIVDDHDMLRSGVAVFLQAFPDLQLVGETGSGVQALDMCRKLRPDVLLVDLIMPDMDGVTVVQCIHQEMPTVRCIALTSYDDPPLVRQAVQAGAISYLLKSVSIDELAAAIRSAHVGQSTLSREASQALIFDQLSRLSTDEYHLTTREREVLAFMVSGLSNGEIAVRLSIGLSTVKKHVSSILAKLKTTSRTEAVVLAMRLKLVEPR